MERSNYTAIRFKYLMAQRETGASILSEYLMVNESYFQVFLYVLLRRQLPFVSLSVSKILYWKEIQKLSSQLNSYYLLPDNFDKDHHLLSMQSILCYFNYCFLISYKKRMVINTKEEHNNQEGTQKFLILCCFLLIQDSQAHMTLHPFYGNLGEVYV